MELFWKGSKPAMNLMIMEINFLPKFIMSLFCLKMNCFQRLWKTFTWRRPSFSPTLGITLRWVFSDVALIFKEVYDELFGQEN